MNETCDRCGPAVRAVYRVNRDGELSMPALRQPAVAGAVRAGLDRVAGRRAWARAVGDLVGRELATAPKDEQLSYSVVGLERDDAG
jgi:hypothetical protein